MSKPDLVPPQEAAKILKCSPSAFRWNVGKGRLSCYEKIGIRTFYKREEVVYFSNHRPPAMNKKREEFSYQSNAKESISQGIEKADLKETLDRWQIHSKDKSSSDVEIGIYTAKIEGLEDELKRLAHCDPDRRSIRGQLIRYVGERRRLLNYLRSTDESRYKQAVARLDRGHPVA